MICCTMVLMRHKILSSRRPTLRFAFVFFSIFLNKMYQKFCTNGVNCTLLILVIVHLLTESSCHQNINQSHYVGAVVEYKPIGTPWDSTPDELLRKNCDNYVGLIDEAVAQGADIIVFPEFGLTTIGMPRDRKDAKPYLQVIPEIGYNPCDLTSGENLTVVEKLSCSAQSARIYVAVNLGEIQECGSNEGCPEDGVHQYSTTVVFDREGTIIAKYHKHRIYFEPQFESPPEPEISTFETDFGVKFGLITSYDIVFDSPAVQLMADGVRNIIFPMVWYDQLPFLTAIQAHSMWAAGVNVNLLAAGYHEPSNGQLGSGIFSGKAGTLSSTVDPNSGTRIIFAEIPVNPLPGDKATTENPKTDITPDRNTNEPLVHYTFIREDLENYTTTILDMTSGSQVQKVCNKGLCCEANYIPTLVNLTSDSDSSFNYRLVARNGTRKIAQGTHQFAWQVCGILRCLNSTLESCTDRSALEEQYINFDFLEITGGPFHTDQIMQPSLNVLDIHYNIIPMNSFEFKIIANDYVRISSKTVQNIGIQTTAIIGRIYLRE